MGSNVSSERKDKFKDKPNYLESNDFLSNFFNNSQSYQGIRSEISSKSNESSSKVESQSDDARSTNMEEKEGTPTILNKIPIIFLWKEGGNTVYLTGSFSNWKQFFIMTKSNKNDHEFSIMLELPVGQYQFKFVVDSVWRTSNEYQKINDGLNNYNNYIENTNHGKLHINEINSNQKKNIPFISKLVKYFFTFSSIKIFCSFINFCIFF